MWVLRNTEGERNPQSKLTNLQVKHIWKCCRNGVSHTELAALFGVHHQRIAAIFHGRQYAKVTQNLRNGSEQ